jgi:hypothetical protein
VDVEANDFTVDGLVQAILEACSTHPA